VVPHVSTDLTPFERRIFALRVLGLSRKDVARRLNRSPQTISNALTVAKEKLGATSLIEAAVVLATLDLTQRA
jgi:DNA-binding NarL/FixJ family response regulator